MEAMAGHRRGVSICPSCALWWAWTRRRSSSIARKIGTFETSILPYEDCCTVFTPRHPRLRPLPGEVEFAEEKLDIQALIQAAVDGIERVQV